MSKRLNQNQFAGWPSAWKTWRWAFFAFILIELLFVVFGFFTYTRNCNYCQQPLMSFISHGVLEIIFTGLLWYFLNRIHERSAIGTFLINISAFVIYFILWIAIRYFQVKTGIFEEAPGDNEDGVLEEIIYNSWFTVGKYVLKISAFYLIRFYINYKKTEQQRTELALINKDLQLNLLKEQLSPHFYFNTLNNLYGLSISNNGKLPQALGQLSNIMHYVLEDCNKPQVSLSQEINFLQSYIALEKLRYEQHTHIEMLVEGEPDDRQILPLLLIQFVENAFKHGMKEKLENNWMKVKMGIHDNELQFRVDNSYYAQHTSPGIGLTNLRHRLNLHYGENFEMNSSQDVETFSVWLKLRLS